VNKLFISDATLLYFF